jgi:hypothetical protein
MGEKRRMEMTNVVVTYGKGEGKKGSVRMKPISVENEVVQVTSIGDYYVSREIMNKLDLHDSDSIKVTFEKA